MNKQINNIKDKIYEVEGLLELLQLRNDKLDELMPLIRGKLSEAAESIGKLSPSKVEESVAQTPTDALVYDEPADGDDSYNLTAADDEIMMEDFSTRKQLEKSQKDKKLPSFCLNDRFRFRRALFGGNDAEFNATMEHLSTLSDYSEAEELFYQDMGLDPEDPDVIDFMAVIKTYFES